MATAEHREPCDSRGSCTVLGAPGGETPSGDSPVALLDRRRGRRRSRRCESCDQTADVMAPLQAARSAGNFAAKVSPALARKERPTIQAASIATGLPNLASIRKRSSAIAPSSRLTFDVRIQVPSGRNHVVSEDRVLTRSGPGDLVNAVDLGSPVSRDCRHSLPLLGRSTDDVSA